MTLKITWAEFDTAVSSVSETSANTGFNSIDLSEQIVIVSANSISNSTLSPLQLSVFNNTIIINGYSTSQFDTFNLNVNTAIPVSNNLVEASFSDITLNKINVTANASSLPTVIFMHANLSELSAIAQTGIYGIGGFTEIDLANLQSLPNVAVSVETLFQEILLNNTNTTPVSNKNINVALINTDITAVGAVPVANIIKSVSISSINLSEILSQAISNVTAICNIDNISLNEVNSNVALTANVTLLNISLLSPVGTGLNDGSVTAYGGFVSPIASKLQSTISLSKALTLTSLLSGVISANPVVVSSKGRPYLDINKGQWTASSGSDLFAMLNEDIPDDNTAISTDTPSICRMKFTSVTNYGRNLSVSYRVSSETNSDILVKIFQGNSLIASWIENNVPTTKTQFRHILSNEENALITDYSNLYIEFEVL